LKILLVTAEYPPYGSGIAKVVFRLRNQMLKKGLTIDVLTPRGDITNALISLFGLVRVVPFWEDAANIIAKKSGDYDAIWLHSPLLINANKLSHVKKIMISIHSTYFGFYEAYKSHGIGHLLPYYYFGTKLENRFLGELPNNSPVITTVSPSVADELVGNGLNSVPYIVPNGFDMNFQEALDKYNARELINREYNLKIDEHDRILLYVGRITEVKQPLLLAMLFGNIFTETNIHLIMLGNGNLLRKLKEIAQNQDNLHVLGHIEHVHPFLKAADAFVSLSCYEGLPLAVLEAASLNLPLILSDIPAHRWIINSNLGHGILLDSYKPSITRILNFLKDNEKRQPKVDSSFLAQFGWENIIKQYLKLLK
jgi:glycosyltransferase involved in cell wall biosynthesis